MGLESATFIESLDSNNPVGALDQRHEGDDHLKLIKNSIRNTFPGMAGRAWRVLNKSASGPLIKNENMTLQNAAGGIILSPDAPAVLGNGWMTYVRAVGGNVSLSSTSNINGSSADYTIPAGHIALLLCDGVEFFAVVMYESTPSTPPVFPAGTKMVFHQTVAPTGWTKLTGAQYNDAGLRMTTGTVGTGGADAFTTLFGPGKATAGHTLTLAQSAPHTHAFSAPIRSGSFEGGGGSATQDYNNGGTNLSLSTEGGGGSHAHNLSNFDIKFVDVITAEKT